MVVGGGAAGFFAAIACAEADPHAHVTILESGNPLSKVRISGGGRCNVTHDEPDPALLIANASFSGADYVLLRADQLPAEFFDLSSRFAGMVMQKFSNYRLRLVIVGGPAAADDAASESLLALIRESNRGDQTWFVKDRAEALARIGG